MIHLSVPDRARIDEQVPISCRGLVPARPVTVTVRATVNDQPWLGVGRYHPSPEGELDVAGAASLAGTYTGRSAMGLFWSQLGPDRAAIMPNSARPVETTVTVRHNDVEVSRTLVRFATGPRTSTAALKSHGCVGTLFHPSDRPAPPVLVLGGSEGGQNDLVAALLATHGYTALALTYFGAPGLPVRLAGVPLEYFIHAIDWLAEQPQSLGRRVAVYGNSKGGEAALLVGSMTDRVAAVAAMVPSGVTLPNPDTGEPAWSPGDEQPSAIEVERIAGPVLIVSCEQDLVWSPALADVAARRLRAAAHSPSDVVVRAPRAGHLVQAPHLPTTAQILPGDPELRLLGGTAAANARAARLAWRHTLALLRRVMPR